MNVRFITFVTLLFHSYSLFAQQESLSQNNVKIASPTAASLGKFADIPVSYHTGIPNISIPIYTIKEGPLELPISLDYHASGLKVMEQSSWVGAGWALNAGGVITRSVRGLPDELESNPASSTSIGYLKSNGFYNYLYTEGSPKTIDFGSFGQNTKDGEADLFFYNFGNYSGKFYFREDGTVVTLPQQDVQIVPQFCMTATGPCNWSVEKLYGWIITTPDGVQYTFGKTISDDADVDPIEHTTNYTTLNGINPNIPLSSWHLNQIMSPDKRFTITLTYASESYSYYTLSLFPVAGGSSNGMDLVKNFIRGVRLASISFSNGSVAFTPDTDVRHDLSNAVVSLKDNDNDNTQADVARALKSISINGPSGFCKKFTLTTDYFQDGNSLTGTIASASNSGYNIHSDQKRLYLKSIQELSCDESVSKPAHIFTYYDATSVPRTLSLGQDHWGYYNGVTDNTTLIPSFSLDGGTSHISGYNANREPAWPAMRAGTLQSIQYPTGGTTKFDFQAHDIPGYSTVGGLRINTITHSATDTNPIAQSFSYVDDNNVSSGVLFSQPDYVAVARNNVFSAAGVPTGFSSNGFFDFNNLITPNGSIETDSNGQLAYFVSPINVHPMKTTQGNHIGYNQVKVTEGDGGFTTYKYTKYTNPAGGLSIKQIQIYKSPYNDADPSYPEGPEQMDFNRGELIYAGVHSATALLRETFYLTSFQPELNGVDGLMVRSYNTYYMPAWYNQKTAKKTMMKELQLEYNPQNSNEAPVATLKETDFDSPYHCMPTRVVVSDVTTKDINSFPVGIVLSESHNTYVGDVFLPAWSQSNSCDNNLQLALTQAASTYQSTLQNPCDANCKYNAWQSYVLAIAAAHNLYGICRITNTTQNFINLNNANTYNAATSSLQTLINLRLRNQINPVIEQSLWRKGMFLKSSLLTYQDFGVKKKIDISPSELDEINYSSPQASTVFTPVTFSNTDVVKDGNYKTEETYKYSLGNLSEVTAKSGVTTSYMWGYNNTLPIAIVKNASSNQIFYDGFEQDFSTGCKAGIGCYGGGYYQVTLPSPGTYTLTYWQQSNGGPWTLVTVPNVTTDQTIQTTGILIDELRLYPQGALMSNYIHHPITGITTSSDENYVMKFYKYDKLGRLLTVKDDQNNIEQEYRYQYYYKK